ncbi:transposase [Crenobacter sp. SG2303]|uniref:Transposase n=1 Tax=Crenobacter oryzisoli TaxID=3056844 RepID=A0ABT7XVJ2_9NEIS|nr:transposase [Crenobacter sp. SG2303]MDN0077750.1 transposase [Crenobacter sp. SG2303]
MGGGRVARGDRGRGSRHRHPGLSGRTAPLRFPAGPAAPDGEAGTGQTTQAAPDGAAYPRFQRQSEKAKAHAVARQQYAKHVRHDFAHQTSHRLVDAASQQTRLIVFEALRVTAMAKKQKAKQDEHGRWQRNSDRAKAGLNRKILASAWGKTREFAHYKVMRANKLMLAIAPHHTSQECSACGHIHPDNRPTQAGFVCQQCGFMANADDNASLNIARRGVQLLLSGAYQPKAKKKTMRLKNKVGAERAEPSSATTATPGEIRVSRGSGNRTARRSKNPETPTTRRLAVSGG